MAWNLDCASDSDRADFADPATRGAASICARRLQPGRLSQPGHSSHVCGMTCGTWYSVMCVQLGTSIVSIPHHATYRDRNAARFFPRRSDPKGSSAWNKHFAFLKAHAGAFASFGLRPWPMARFCSHPLVLPTQARPAIRTRAPPDCRAGTRTSPAGAGCRTAARRVQMMELSKPLSCDPHPARPAPPAPPRAAASLGSAARREPD
jgi:hypothetical protein